jgi:signal transduction histidine kinase
MLTSPTRIRWRPAALLVAAIVVGAGSVQAAEVKAILLLHSYGYDTPGRLAFDAAFIRAAREGGAGSRIELYIETIDPNRFRGEAQGQLVRRYLRERYADKSIGVVAAVYDRALGFVLDEHEPLFPGVPIVAVLTSQPASLPARASYVWSGVTFGESAALAMKLSPRARQIALVDGATLSPASEAVYEEARAQVAAATPNIEVLALRNLPLDELLARIAALPAETPIVMVRQLLGARGQSISTLDAVRELAAVARGPIYVSADQQIGVGALGGIVVAIDDEAMRLANLALRVADDPTLQVPPAKGVPVAMFDWRQLRRWRIEEKRLPAGSIVKFREPGAWESYRGYILAGTFVLVLQTGLIGGLVIQRARRRRIELALRNSEAALRLSADRNQDLAGRLIAAQETERTRIARDLHDDVGQQLAGIGIMLSALKRVLTRTARRDAEETVRKLQERTTSLAETLRNLSHELHPGVLRNVGLVAAVRQHAADVQRHYGITVAVEAPVRLDELDGDVALCLYRVMQEALSNIARHAHATIAAVSLVRTDAAIELRVADDGVGFDPGVRGGTGIGLRSIDERVRLARGRVQLESRPGRGTELTVRIPLDPAPIDVARRA